MPLPGSRRRRRISSRRLRRKRCQGVQPSSRWRQHRLRRKRSLSLPPSRRRRPQLPTTSPCWSMSRKLSAGRWPGSTTAPARTWSAPATTGATGCGMHNAVVDQGGYVKVGGAVWSAGVWSAGEGVGCFGCQLGCQAGLS